jgi:spore coat polysaccharide biosynthesis protein SpsF
MSTMAFIQARTGSTRLPGKALEPLAGRSALLRVVDRLRVVRGIDAVAVLTSTSAGDSAIVDLCDAEGIICLRGSEDDVLDRFHMAAQELGPGCIVRVTADCPLIDANVVERLIRLASAHGDPVYASVATGAIGPERGLRRFPDGLDAEAFSAEALEIAWREATGRFEREHVTPFLWSHPERFPPLVLEADEDLGEERWTLDYPADLEFIKAIYSKLDRPGTPFGYRKVLELLKHEPELRMLNEAHRPARS